MPKYRYEQRPNIKNEDFQNNNRVVAPLSQVAGHPADRKRARGGSRARNPAVEEGEQRPPHQEYRYQVYSAIINKKGQIKQLKYHGRE
jgi:hypothetical protein